MKRIKNKPVIKYVLLALFTAGIFMLTGCGERPAAGTVIAPVPEKNPYITCFGLIAARVTYPVCFPFGLEVENVDVRSGQAVSADEVLFQADYERLLEEQTLINQNALSLSFQKSGFEKEINKLQDDLAACTLGAYEFKPEEMMELLKAIAAGKNSISKFGGSRLALILALQRFGLLAHYQELLSFALSGDKFYREQANPLLMQLDSQFDSQLPALAAQLDVKQALLNQTENEIMPAQSKADAVNAFLSGQAFSHMKLEKNGNVCLADSGYMVDTVYVLPNTSAPADRPVISLIVTDSLEAVCFVEEQLVKGIRPGDNAQLSLYTDSTVVALGKVSFVSQKAVEVNGETVVEVVITYENGSFLPGYNIVAKIFPESPE